MRIAMMVAVVAFGCSSRTIGTRPETGAQPDTPPELRCSTGHEDKIMFSFAQSCANDGSVEFCIPDGDPQLRSALAAISPMITCAPGGGRARCHRSPGLLLCSYPTTYPAQCTTPHGSMTADAWSDMCEIAALPQVTEIVPTIFE